MSAALLIDVILWGSVIAVGFIAYQKGPTVLTSSLREGTWDFIGIIPRIALGVVGSGYIAAVIPQEIITGWLGPNSGWLGVATAVVAGAATPGGPVVGFSIGAVALKSGGGSPQVLAYVIAWALFAFQRLLLQGGRAGGSRLLSRSSVELMQTNQELEERSRTLEEKNQLILMRNLDIQ